MQFAVFHQMFLFILPFSTKFKKIYVPASKSNLVNKRTRSHGGLEILAIRYLWNKANSFVFFLRELIKGQGPRVHRTIKNSKTDFPLNRV